MLTGKTVPAGMLLGQEEPFFRRINPPLYEFRCDKGHKILNGVECAFKITTGRLNIKNRKFENGPESH
jgi:hypothetical protein